jgi:iron complex outermembrane receptor protein
MFSFTAFAENDAIRVLHTKVIRVKEGEDVNIKANIINSYKLNYSILHYKNINDKTWSEKEMKPIDGLFMADIPSQEMGKTGLVYYIEVIDIEGKSIEGFGSKENPQYIDIVEIKAKKDLITENKNNSNGDDFSEYMDELKEIYEVEVVTASKKSEKASDAPATVYVVTQSMIKKRGYSNLEEVLEDIPGVEIQHKSTAEYENYITVRGIAGNEKLVILMDGYKISPTDNTPSTVGTNYPIIGVKQIEVILGPASALYGPDAVNGVINIITKKGRDVNGVEISSSYGLDNTTNNYFVAGTEVDGLSIMLTGHLYHSDEPYLPDYYKDEYSWYLNEYKNGGKVKILPETGGLEIPLGESEEYSTPTNSYSIHAKLNYRNFELGYFRTQESHNTSIGGRPEYNLYVEDAVYKTIVETAYLQHKFLSSNKKLNLQSSIWFGSYELHPDSMFNNQFTAFNRAYKYGFGRTVKLEEQFSFQINKNHSVIAGLTYDKNNSLPESSDLPRKYNTNLTGDEQGLEYPGTNLTDKDGNDLRIYQDFYYVEYDNIGTYLQYQGKFFDIVNATLGSRYDYNTRYGSSINPRAGLVFFLGSFTWKLLYGMAFLAPSPYLSYQHYGAFLPTTEDPDNPNSPITGLFGPFWRLPNSDLEPERLSTFETTLSYKPARYMNFSLNLYYQKLTNIITSEVNANLTEFKGIPVSTIVTRTNQGESLTYGGTLQITSFLKVNSKINLNPYLAYSYSDGDLDGNILPYTAKHTIKGGIDIKLWNVLFSTRGLYKTRTYHKFANEVFRENASPSDYGSSSLDAVSSPSYFLLNMSLRYENIFNTDKFNLSIFLNVNNVLDSRYYNVALADSEGFIATPQDPIRVLGGLVYKW